MTKYFKKSKKPYFAAILRPSCPNLGKNEFSWKKGLCQFLNIPIIYHQAKNQKKLMIHSWKKCRTDGRTDRQRWFYKTLRRTGIQYLHCMIDTKQYNLNNLIKDWQFLRGVVCKLVLMWGKNLLTEIELHFSSGTFSNQLKCSHSDKIGFVLF